jgi:quinolinate synthase
MSTLAAVNVVEEILALKKERNAVILAHHYQEPEIQEIADAIGDSLELARKAKDLECDVIAFCGVWFMAETAKILNPSRTVVVPDREAGCSLVDSCPVEMVRAFKNKYPDHVVVSYINTSADVKAESDIICTSRNAVQIVNSIPADKPILFLPDINLGNYVKKQTGRHNMRIWQGACIVHTTFAERKLLEKMHEHPEAFVVAHPECPAQVLEHAGFIGSTSALIDFCVKSEHKSFIVMTESGVQFSMRRLAPEKAFWFVTNENCNCSECPYMKKNSLEKLRDSLAKLAPKVELPVEMMDKARLSIERMLAVK